MTFWNGKNVFVTGATGLLGSHLTEELLARGARVTVLVRDWVPDSRAVSSSLLPQCQVVRGELEDHLTMLRILNEYEIDTVFHLGAQTIVGTASRSAMSTFEANIRGTWCLLEAAKQCMPRIQRVVVASSDKAYGAHEVLPYTEDAPLQGRFPYDVSKSCTDLISFSYWHTYRVPIAVTRCGNLFGAGDLNFNRLIPGTIRALLQGDRPVIRSDGTFVRDYFYVRDAVNAYLQLAERMPGEAFCGEAFNFGTETPMTVLEVVDRLLAVMGISGVTPQILGEASHEIPKQFLDCAKARARMDWHPHFTFDAALADTVVWYREWLAARQRPVVGNG
ncbi:MAG: GDP-mannose 4,6-dehydratase [Gemmatimonadaceae bacterium]|nr:GDP-mannose 4,6-dehydratase [Gemmatimonadaceae bacterium]